MRPRKLLAVVAWAAGCAGAPDGTPDDPLVDLDGDGALSDVDCDDQNAVRFPGATERCDGVDDDCDGEVDEDAADRVLADHDGDGFGVEGALVCADGSPVPAAAGDCADDDPTRHPGAPERCNGVDDDCDADTPEVVQVGDVAFGSLADALEAAPDGGTVQVCAGTHPADRLLVDKAVTVVGDVADPAATVLDAGGNGAVFLVSGGTLTLEGLTLTGGAGARAPALDDELAGGAVSALVGAGGAVTARSCVFTGNQAWAGGAVAGTEVTLEDCTLEDNRAEDSGGAVLVRGDEGHASLTLLRTVVQHNQAETGGGVHAREAALTVTDSELRDNVAGGMGGALYALAFGQEAVTVVGTTVADNRAFSCGGFAIESFDAVVLDDATTLSGNVVDYVGGGACFDGERWTGGTLVANTALRGGGLWSLGWRTTLSGVVLRENVATDGGGLWWASAGSITLDGLEITANEAAGVGGGARLLGAVTLTGGSVVDNVAAARGGGLFIEEGSTVAATDVSFGPGENLPEDVALTNGTQVAGFDYGEAASFTCEADPTPVCRDEEAR